MAQLKTKLRKTKSTDNKSNYTNVRPEVMNSPAIGKTKQGFYDHVPVWGDPVYVELDKLRIDPLYQRQVKEKKLKEIRSSYNDHEYRYPRVSTRLLESDGLYNVFDGQHTTIIKREQGFDRIKVIVHELETIEEEAFLFNRYNVNSKRLLPIEIFWAEHAAKEQRALDIHAVALGEGFDIPRCPTYSARKYPFLGCIVNVKNTYSYGGKIHLRKCLYMVRESWEGDDTAVSEEMIKGVDWFLRLFQPQIGTGKTHRITMKRLCEAFSKIPCYKISAMASQMFPKGTKGGGNHRGKQIAYAMEYLLRSKIKAREMMIF